jgi:hypothetical protein
VAPAHRLEEQLVAVVAGLLEGPEKIVGQVRGVHVELTRAHRLGEGLLEGTTDGHGLSHRLHRGVEAPIRAGELLEGEAGPLDHHVVDRGLEAGGRLARDVVVDLLERVAHREPGRDLRDREAGGLGGQRRGARDTRVHLDHRDLVGAGIDGELDVRAAGVDPHGPDHGQGLVAQALVLDIGERLLGRHGHAVAGVHSHRVDVLDRADDHHVVVVIAHHLELELAPADHRLLHEHLADRAGGQALGHHLAILRLGPGDAAPGTTHREAGPHDRGQADLEERPLGLAHRLDRGAARHAQPRPLHRRAEQVAVLGAPDRLVVGADQLDPVPAERAVLGELPGEVERGAAAQRGQQSVRLLALDHPRHRVRQERLDVGGRGEFRVGHDRGRVGVDEDHLVALFEQHLAGLRARVVELRRLTDHDRPRAEHEDLVEVVAARHQAATRRSRKRSNRWTASCGPGPASGWYWTVEPGTSRSTSPSTVRS